MGARMGRCREPLSLPVSLPETWPLWLRATPSRAGHTAGKRSVLGGGRRGGWETRLLLWGEDKRPLCAASLGEGPSKGQGAHPWGRGAAMSPTRLPPRPQDSLPSSSTWQGLGQACTLQGAPWLRPGGRAFPGDEPPSPWGKWRQSGPGRESLLSCCWLAPWFAMGEPVPPGGTRQGGRRPTATGRRPRGV